jgi:HSP20 family protein
MSRLDTASYGPFAWMRQMQDQLDRAFTGLWGSTSGSSWTPETVFGPSDWAPAIDVFQRGNDLVIRADVPGLSKDDITVDIADDQLTIRGERRHDHEEERDGVFRSERSYGSFCRVIPLPQGAIADSAKATVQQRCARDRSASAFIRRAARTPRGDQGRGVGAEVESTEPEDVGSGGAGAVLDACSASTSEVTSTGGSTAIGGGGAAGGMSVLARSRRRKRRSITPDVLA